MERTERRTKKKLVKECFLKYQGTTIDLGSGDSDRLRDDLIMLIMETSTIKTLTAVARFIDDEKRPDRIDCCGPCRSCCKWFAAVNLICYLKMKGACNALTSVEGVGGSLITPWYRPDRSLNLSTILCMSSTSFSYRF